MNIRGAFITDSTVRRVDAVLRFPIGIYSGIKFLIICLVVSLICSGVIFSMCSEASEASDRGLQRLSTLARLSCSEWRS